MRDLIDRQSAIARAVPLNLFGREVMVVSVSELENLPSAQPEQQNARIFQGIIVEYPTISTYPECKGKPYFSIKYTENGQEFIGYGTYKPEVLSEYLKEYFMPPAQPEVRPIDYQDCSNAMLKMWMDNVVTDGEYNRIMDKLNAHWGKKDG